MSKQKKLRKSSLVTLGVLGVSVLAVAVNENKRVEATIGSSGSGIPISRGGVRPITVQKRSLSVGDLSRSGQERGVYGERISNLNNAETVELDLLRAKIIVDNEETREWKEDYGKYRYLTKKQFYGLQPLTWDEQQKLKEYKAIPTTVLNPNLSDEVELTLRKEDWKNVPSYGGTN